MALSMAQKLNYQGGVFFNAAAVTKSDSEDLPNIAHAIWVGGAGNLKVTLLGMDDGAFVILNSVAAGATLPIVGKRVWDGSTTTNMVALY